ncbi:MAG: hypothetical protein WA130_07280 [Candidatus Methanoperedens sp.]
MKNSNKQIFLTETIFFSGFILALVSHSLVVLLITLAIAVYKSTRIDAIVKKKEEAETQKI